MDTKRFEALFAARPRVALLGFGQEGQSTFHTLRRYVPGLQLSVCDRSPEVASLRERFDPDGQAAWWTGAGYLEGLREADLIIRSPGIPFRVLEGLGLQAAVESQTGLFLALFRDRIAGITGTKGKSTTSSLLHHILSSAGKRSVLAGNIGRPVFELIPDMREDTLVVFEMSSHQLQYVSQSPHAAVLLNLFPEHLDHYASYEEYGQAKANICRWQHKGDAVFYNLENEGIRSLMGQMAIPSSRIVLGRGGDYHARFEGNDLLLRLPAREVRLKDLAGRVRLPGRHNLMNVAAAAAVAVHLGVDTDFLPRAVEGFEGLPHRLEHCGTVGGVQFFNDSISTVPESTLAAIDTLPRTAALILGGHDRGVDYGVMIRRIGQSGIPTLVFVGEAGRRMMGLACNLTSYRGKQCLMAGSFDEAFSLAAAACRAGDVCLLSPAAASYDSFANFRERGDRFRALVAGLKRS